MITTVTITGADDSIAPAALFPLTSSFPFVEWGILVSKKRVGSNRFPSEHWLKKMEHLKYNIPEIKLSCHLCGTYVRELCAGNDIVIKELNSLWDIFDRIQLNFHAIPHKIHESVLDVLKKYSEKEFIFQYDNVNNEVIHFVNNAGIKCSALFDTSGGAGILPDSWSEPLKNIKCGYAGGISPDNIEEQIKLIENKVGDIETWIDMETHVRSNNDYQFDLIKVEKCLEIASKFVK